MYLYHGFRSNGGIEVLEGHDVENGWQFAHEEEIDGTRQRTRVIITRISDDHFKLVAESAEGDNPWTVEGLVNYRRITSYSDK